MGIGPLSPGSNKLLQVWLLQNVRKNLHKKDSGNLHDSVIRSHSEPAAAATTCTSQHLPPPSRLHHLCLLPPTTPSPLTHPPCTTILPTTLTHDSTITPHQNLKTSTGKHENAWFLNVHEQIVVEDNINNKTFTKRENEKSTLTPFTFQWQVWPWHHQLGVWKNCHLLNSFPTQKTSLM